MPKPKPKSPFAGSWRIVSMEMLDQDYVDEEVEAYIEFDGKGWGDFHLGVTGIPHVFSQGFLHSEGEKRLA
jgi:hypothetical protein